MLLLQLKGMEVNPAYPLSKLGTPVVSVHVDQKKILFHLKATSHPQVGKYKADCYDYQVMFITWGTEVDAEVKMSAWRYLDEEPPKFKFWFDRKADVKHWLFCVRLELGIKGESIGTLASRGMQVIDAGSFVKKDVEILENREKEKKKVKAAGIAKKKELEIKRVQADTT